MDNDSLQELRTLLFGEEPSDSRPEPEFQVLVDLAPLLKEPALERLIEEVSMMGMATMAQFRALVAMLAFLPGSRVEAALGKAISQHEALLPYLSDELVLKTLAGVRTVVPDEGDRAEVILGLAARLPRAQMHALILEEILAAGRVPDPGYSTQRAVRTLVVGLKEPLAEETGADLYQLVSRLDDPGTRLLALANLAPLLPEPTRELVSNQVLEAIRGEVDLGRRATLLLTMAAREKDPLQTSLLEEAFSAARALELKDRRRHMLLVEISLYEADEAREQILKEAQRPFEEGLIVWPSGAEALVRNFGELALRLAQDRAEVLRSEIQKLPLPANLLDLRPLLPFLSEAQYEAALEMFSDPYWDEVMADAFTNLALNLPENLAAAALEQLAGWQVEKIKFQSFSALVPTMPADLLPRALEIAAGFESDRWRARAAEALSSRPDWSNQGHPIFNLPFPGGQIRRLWTTIPAGAQNELLSELLERLWGNYGGMQAANGGGKSISPEEMSDHGGERDGQTGSGAPSRETDDEVSVEAGQPVVNTGFAPSDSPDAEISREEPLVQGRPYYFWLHIGRQKGTAIAADSPALDVSKLPPEAELTVALFAFERELEITPGADIGVVKILASRVMEVVQPAAEPAGLEASSRLKSQLYFPVRTPDRAGDFRLRCSLYYERVLLQSHLITARVVPDVDSGHDDKGSTQPGHPLRHTLDYTLTNTLQTEIFTELENHSLSLLINDNGDGTHGFRFFGGENGQVVKEDATFTALELQDMIEQARGAMRKVTWDTKEAWTPADDYRYRTKPADAWVGRLQNDLVRFAKWGARFYRAALQKIAETGAADLDEADQRKEQLEAAVRKPGRLQIAAKESSRHVLPAALIYDHPIHDALPGSMYKLCPEFLEALEKESPIQDTACFQGACPSRGDLRAVCPSGFWGYRHVLGFPVSIGPEASESEVMIRYGEAPQVSAMVSLDKDFKLRKDHIDKLQHLRTGLGWKYGDDGQEILDLMRDEHSHLVYFYCHGGLTEEGVPYLQVGPEDDFLGIITPSLLPNYQIKWKQPKPLVFINGCHTTALEPAKSLDLVTSFVKEARAVGVIGTEITIFEPLAAAFAEECLAHFLNGVPIGDAVRRARLKLLHDGNPLGLVYIPFVMSSVRLVKEGGGN